MGDRNADLTSLFARPQGPFHNQISRNMIATYRLYPQVPTPSCGGFGTVASIEISYRRSDCDDFAGAVGII